MIILTLKPPLNLQEISISSNQSSKGDLKKASLLLITFGTSWIYEKKLGKELVSNCHKVPQKEFDKRLLNLDEILSSFFKLQAKLEEINPELTILLTVSPIRHTRSGMVNNSKSKSNLIMACHYLQKMLYIIILHTRS